MRVAITGVSGYLGQSLFQKLAADPVVESILGLDLREPDFHSEKLLFLKTDVRKADFASLLKDVDVLYHLAFVVEQPRGMKASEVFAINVEGSRRVFQGALLAGVKKIVFSSSVAVYGAHRDNPPVLTEESPLRPNPGWHYARSKGEVEGFLDELRLSYPDRIVIRFRPCIVIGPGLEHILGCEQTGNRILCFDRNLKVDFCWGDDLAEAFRLALHYDRSDVFKPSRQNNLDTSMVDRHKEPQQNNLNCTGYFGAAPNVAADNPLALAEISGILHQGLFCPHRFWMRPLLKIGVLLGQLSEGDVHWLFPGADGPIIVSSARAKERLGWKPKYDCAGMLRKWMEMKRTERA